MALGIRYTVEYCGESQTAEGGVELDYLVKDCVNQNVALSDIHIAVEVVSK